MNHHDIDQSQVVDRYLMGKLPPDETAAFEEHYLHCQECLDQLELTEKLWRGLKREAARDAERALASRQLGILAWLARHSRRRQLSLVIAVLLVMAVLPSLVYRVLDRDGQEADQAMVHPIQPFPDFNELGQLRSDPAEHSEPVYRIPLPPSTEWLPLKLLLGHAEYQSYRVTLFREGVPDPVSERDGFEPTDDDALILRLSPTVLHPGDYSLRVEALPPGGEPVDEGAFSFRALAEQ
ncbi:MAG: hypothetical protein GY856_39445 [bacterium]|nr:hypothetical protein [bacterium]